MNWFTESLYHAAAMFWEMFWPLVFGFGISAILQVFVSKHEMAKHLGNAGFREIALAMGLGTASSSCSYSAAATMKTAFKKGAHFVTALAFLIASTNLVVELGFLLVVLMGWHFLFAEILGAFVMVAVAWGLVRIMPAAHLIEQARAHVQQQPEVLGNEAHGEDDAGFEVAIQSPLKLVADAFVNDWAMLWKEIVIGVLIAGFLMTLVPMNWWQQIFVARVPYPLRLLENAVAGPLVAAISCVCSIGNVPLASLLWSGGCSFGGVIAFLYGDLIVLPLIFAYRKYYGGKMAAYMAFILFISMIVAGIVVDLLFTVMGWIPQGPRPEPVIARAAFEWNHTAWLNLIASCILIVLVILHFRKPQQIRGLAPHRMSKNRT